MQSVATFKVVLTGGIASGKSAVAAAFEKLGVTVIDLDQVARDVVEPGKPALAQIVATFGAECLDASGRMDRRRMRERVFADPQQRRALEAITHPAIRAEVAQRSTMARGPYQIHVIPLYVEGGARGGYDRVLVVDCPREIQLQRLMQRDGMDMAGAERILAAQASREQRLAVADDVITNTGSLDELDAKVMELHTRYLSLSA